MIVFSVVYAGTAEDAFGSLNSAISDGVGWWYILTATGFVIFALFCGVSRVGNIRLGRDDEQPEFGMLSWFAMLFSAGMGIGLVFYGVAEPLSHYVNPPVAGGVAGSTDAAANQAMELTMFHWGLHAWAIYVVVGLGLAYMTYRKGRPLSIRWLLEPLLGTRSHRRRYRAYHRRDCDHRHVVRCRDLARFRRATDFGRPGLPRLGGDRQLADGRSDHLCHRSGNVLGCLRSFQGPQVALEHQYGSRGESRDLRSRARPHSVSVAVVGAEPRRVCPGFA